MKPVTALPTVILLALAALGSACSSVKVDSNSRFRTSITDQGLKHFEVSLTPARDRHSNGDGRNRGDFDRDVDNRRISKKAQKKLHKLAALYLEENHFCRKGFWVMKDEGFSAAPRLRGECNEAASAEDRQRYPNTIATW